MRFKPLTAPAILTWLGAMTAAALAVGNQFWAQTFLICLLGTLLLLFPPSNLLPKGHLIAFGLLLLLVGTAFLPANWLHPSFRQQFLDHGITLPETLSPQPWLTLEDVALLLATVLWAWVCLESQLSSEHRQFLIVSYLIGIGLLAINLLLSGTSLEWIVPSFLRSAGQFENRNQTGDLLLMAGIFSVSFGLSGLSKHRWRGLFWILLAAIFMVTMLKNGSRAAIVLFAMGLPLLLGLRQENRRHNWQVQLMALLVVLFGTLTFALVDVPFRDRFLVLLHMGQEDRFPIYHDALQMVLRDPLFGVGLGNFEGVFNVERLHSSSFPARCIHPDSDWFWLAAELGLVGVALVALLVVLTFKTYFVKSPCRRLTHASITIAILFLVHSLFDVGGHRLGTIWNCLYLSGLGAFRPVAPAQRFRPSLVLRLAGLALLVVGALRIQSMSLQPWMPTRASATCIEQTDLKNLLPLTQENLLNQNINSYPLDWLAYYQRGLFRLNSSKSIDDANADFNRALYLEQNTVQLPDAIGEVCRYADIDESLVAWKEALRRSGSRREEYLQSLYWRDDFDARTRLHLTALSQGDPDLQVISIVNQDASQFEWLCEDFLNNNPSLDGISPSLSKRLFDRWADVGNANEFISEWPDHPEWRATGWTGYVRALAKVGRYQDAVTIALAQMPTPKIPDGPSLQNLDDAMSAAQANPRDPYYLIQLYFAQVSSGSNEDALTTLAKAAQLPKHPDYIPYLLAKTLAVTDQYQAAWQALAPLLK